MGSKFDSWPKRDKKVLWIWILMGWKGELSFLDLSKSIGGTHNPSLHYYGGGCKTLNPKKAAIDLLDPTSVEKLPFCLYPFEFKVQGTRHFSCLPNHLYGYLIALLLDAPRRRRPWVNQLYPKILWSSNLLYHWELLFP